MREKSDVIVFGGGPCGSFAAYNLARLKMNVKVFEEHREIGVPIHCAGHISIKGLKLLGLYPLPSEIVENTFHGAIFHSPNGNRLHVRFSSPVTCGINRILFDKYIAESAEKSGAEYYMNSTVESLVVEKGFVKGVIAKRKGNNEKFTAKAVIDAEGIKSKVLRQTGLFTPNSGTLVKAVQAEVENVEDTEADMVEVFLSRKYAPGFYAWLMPKRDRNARIGLAAKTSDPRILLRKLMLKHPTASKKLRNAKILRTSFHFMTLGGQVPKTFSDGFLVVGDAASQAKPTTGGGVIFGMTCAKIAAETISEALKNVDFSSDSLSKYQKQCRKKLGSEIKFMLKTRKMLDALPDKKLDDIINFYNRIGLEKTLHNFENIDFQWRSLLNMLWHPRIPLALFYFFLSYLSTNR